MNIQLSENDSELINKIASDNGFSEYKITTNSATATGDNFLGVLTLVEIIDKNKKLDLIIKTAVENETLKKQFPLDEVYSREIYLYQIIFNEFKKYQNEQNIKDPFLSTAKFYGASKTKNSFALENLKAEQYQLWDRKVPMNPEHISAVLIEYAKFHSISLALKYNNPELYNKLTKRCAKNPFEMQLSDPENFLTNAKIQIESCFNVVEDDDVLLQTLKDYQKNFRSLFDKLKLEENLGVLIHGDCWCNNFMFKYQNETYTRKPTKLCILDWQISRTSSPALDLTYFITINGSEEVLSNYEYYLKLYHDKLSSQLRNFNCDPDIVFPYSELERHFKIFIPFALYMSTVLLKMMVSDSGEVPDLAGYAKDDENTKLEALNYEIKNYAVYKKRFKSVVRFMSDNKFLN